MNKLGIEDSIFTRARLGRHWTPERARHCLLFFPSPYRFSAEREREFQALAVTDYSDNLRGMIANAEAAPTT